MFVADRKRDLRPRGAGVNSTTSLAPNRGLANPAIGPGVGARLLRFLEAADERDELPAIII